MHGLDAGREPEGEGEKDREEGKRQEAKRGRLTTVSLDPLPSQ